MKQPKSIDLCAWARYNEWLSGALIAVTPAQEYADVRGEQTEKGAGACSASADPQHTFNRPGDLCPVSGVVSSGTERPIQT